MHRVQSGRKQGLANSNVADTALPDAGVLRNQPDCSGLLEVTAGKRVTGALSIRREALPNNMTKA